MSDAITGLRQVIQDLVAPELKAHTAKFEMLQKTMELQHESVVKLIESQGKLIESQGKRLDEKIDSFRVEVRSEFSALRANNENEVLRQVSPISERIAVVESRVKQG